MRAEAGVEGQTEPEEAAAIPTTRWVMAAAIFSLNLLDVITTKLILGAGGAEVNPVMQPIIHDPYAAYALSANAEIQCSTDTSFSIDDRSGWVHVESLPDDSCFDGIPLGFTFTGWGRADTTVSVSSNGVLFFGGGCSSEYFNTALPSGISNNPFVAFFWDDLLDLGSGQYFEYTTVGSPGGRVFYLFFRNRLLSNACGTDTINLMLSIHEGSNLVQISYSDFTGCANIRGASATFGMQGPNGSDAVTVGYNAPILDDNAPRQSITYQPPRQ